MVFAGRDPALREGLEKTTSSSPRFYKNTAVLFFAIGGILIWAAIKQHDWVYWAFAAITILNAIMSMLKFYQVRETKS